jgi:hypothetical protein
MLALGIILILLSAGSLVAVLSSGADDKAVLFGNVTMPTLVVFLAGAAALLIFIMGLELVRSGIRRANANRKTKKKLRTLEKREEQRSDGGPTGTADDTEPATTTTPTRTDEEPTATQPMRTSGPTEPTTGQATRGDEPYQTPPPPSR